MKNMINKEEIIKDFEDMVSHAEALIEETANTGIDKLDEVREKAEKTLKIAKAKLANAQNGIIAKTKSTAKAGDSYVHDNPWRSIGLAASIGAVIGLLIGRR